MECVTLDIESGHLRVGDLDTLRVGARIKFAPHCQSESGRRGGDQFNARLATGQRLAPPGVGNVTGQPMLNLVPLRGAGRWQTRSARPVSSASF